MKRNKITQIVIFTMLFFQTNIVKSSSNVEHDVELFAKYNGPATMRMFGLAIGYDTTMYVFGGDVGSNGVNGYISKVSPDGVETPFLNFNTKFAGPGIDVDRKGNIYLAGGDKIFKIFKDGKIETLLTGFKGAFDIKLDAAGNLLIADHKEDKIYKVTPSLEKSVYIDNNAASLGSFVLGGLAFDKEYKNLYSIEISKKEMKRYSLKEDGTCFEPDIIFSNAPSVYCFDIDETGNVFGSDYSRGDFVKINTRGELEYLSNTRRLRNPLGFILGKPSFHEGYAFVADLDGIKKIKLTSVQTEVGQTDIIPGKFSILQNYPNPFNPSTTITFQIPDEKFVSLKIFDSLGREVESLIYKIYPAGEYKYNWNASDKNSGMYICVLKAGEHKISRKLMLLK